MFTNGFDHFNPGKDFNSWMDLDDNAFFNVLREELFGVLNIPAIGAAKSRAHWESVLSSVSDAGAVRGAKVGARKGVLEHSLRVAHQKIAVLEMVIRVAAGTCCKSSTLGISPHEDHPLSKALKKCLAFETGPKYPAGIVSCLPTSNKDLPGPVLDSNANLDKLMKYVKSKRKDAGAPFGILFPPAAAEKLLRDLKTKLNTPPVMIRMESAPVLPTPPPLASNVVTDINTNGVIYNKPKPTPKMKESFTQMSPRISAKEQLALDRRQECGAGARLLARAELLLSRLPSSEQNKVTDAIQKVDFNKTMPVLGPLKSHRTPRTEPSSPTREKSKSSPTRETSSPQKRAKPRVTTQSTQTDLQPIKFTKSSSVQTSPPATKTANMSAQVNTITTEAKRLLQCFDAGVQTVKERDKPPPAPVSQVPGPETPKYVDIIFQFSREHV